MSQDNNSMEQDGSFNQAPKKQRSSEGEWNYFCGCAKSYLSYPALYTHVKNKHDGVFPIGSNAKRRLPKSMRQETERLFSQNKSGFPQELLEIQ